VGWCGVEVQGKQGEGGFERRRGSEANKRKMSGEEEWDGLDDDVWLVGSDKWGTKYGVRTSYKKRPSKWIRRLNE
jgi:hypothetical protein